MNDKQLYEVILTGTTTKMVSIDILDDRYGIKEILRAEDFPIHSWPCGDDGHIKIDGKLVACYYVCDGDIFEEIEAVISSNGDELDVTELDLGV